MYIEQLNPPEHNGQRFMIAACGPRVLEQNALAELVPWEEMPTHEYGGKNWFEKRWIPLCEHLSIDPYQKPIFYDSQEFSGYINRWNENQKDQKSPLEDGAQLWEKLSEKPWKNEDCPQAAQWLQERSKVLDYFGYCVRKPNFICWRQMEPDGMYSILLPDVQANRAFARDLQVRISHRIAYGDTEGAWYDVMSMFIFARRHFKEQPLCVNNFVGVAVEGIGFQQAVRVLCSGNLSKEQLERFSKELETLPPVNSYKKSILAEQLMLLDYVEHVVSDPEQNVFKEVFDGIKGPDVFEKIAGKSVDVKLTRKRIDELYEMSRFSSLADDETIHNRLFRNRFIQNLQTRSEQILVDLESDFQKESSFADEASRSRMVADSLFVNAFPLVLQLVGTYNTCDAKLALLRTAFALERYKKDHGDYPEKLEPLLFTYIDEIPLDPHTNRATLTYQLRPKQGCQYRLYTYGGNGKDDGGKGDTPRGEKNDDVVLEFTAL